MSLRVAIQGYEGSFHHEAAIKFFGKKITIVPCATFRQLTTLTKAAKEVDIAIMAIENSIAGSILPNYNLIRNNKLAVTGELYLHINQNIMVNKGVTLSDVKEIHSHPMALLQCTGFIDTHKLKAVETEDTALSAKHIAQYKSKHVAAIASKIAAQLYNLEIIQANAQDVANNYTRFLIVTKKSSNKVDAKANKASIYFKTNHEAGSLYKALGIIAKAGMNLTKLQSIPVLKTPFQYAFYADISFENINQFNKMIDKLRTTTEELDVYGVYEMAAKHF
jgi:prephenate dehydratase